MHGNSPCFQRHNLHILVSSAVYFFSLYAKQLTIPSSTAISHCLLHQFTPCKATHDSQLYSHLTLSSSSVYPILLALVYDILPPLNCLAFKHKFRSYSVIVFCNETSNNAVCIRFPRSYYPNTSRTVRRALTTRDFTGDFGRQTREELSIRTAPSTAVAN